MRKYYLDFIFFNALFRIHSLILETEQTLSVISVYKEYNVYKEYLWSLIKYHT